MYSVREWFQIRCRARLLKGEAMLPREGGGGTKHYVFVMLCGRESFEMEPGSPDCGVFGLVSSLFVLLMLNEVAMA